MKGMSDFKVYGHTMRNAFIPVITIIGLQVGYLLGGTVVTEEVFTIPGMGRLLVNSIHSRDYAMIQGILLVYTSIFIFVNIAVDVTYHYFDPKISEL
jgi:peptide/nickel transport system permease protein